MARAASSVARRVGVPHGARPRRNVGRGPGLFGLREPRKGRLGNCSFQLNSAGRIYVLRCEAARNGPRGETSAPGRGNEGEQEAQERSLWRWSSRVSPNKASYSPSGEADPPPNLLQEECMKRRGSTAVPCFSTPSCPTSAGAEHVEDREPRRGWAWGPRAYSKPASATASGDGYVGTCILLEGSPSGNPPKRRTKGIVGRRHPLLDGNQRASKLGKSCRE